MNNFPFESPTDLFSSGLLSPTNSLFDSQLNYIADVAQMPVAQTHMNFFAGFRDDFATVSTGYDALTTSIYGMPSIDSSLNQMVGAEIKSEATVVSGTDATTAFSSTDITTVAIPSTESNMVLSGASYEMRVVDDMVELIPSNSSAPSETTGVAHDGSVESSRVAQEVVKAEETTNVDDDVPVINIAINNVVCAFSTKCYLSLRKIALNGMNVQEKRGNGLVSMKLRKPSVTASIWTNGKVTCTGSRSEEESHVAARKIARCLQRIGCKVKFANFRVVNVLGTCSFPWGIRIPEFSRKYPKQASYEPELHPGVTYRIVDPKATLKIFSTGSITVTEDGSCYDTRYHRTSQSGMKSWGDKMQELKPLKMKKEAPCVSNIERAIEHIYPLVLEFRRELNKGNNQLDPGSTLAQQSKRPFQNLLKRPMPTQSNQKQKRGYFINMDSNSASSTDSDY